MIPPLYNSSLLCDVNTFLLDHMLENFTSHLPVLLNLTEVHKIFYLKLYGWLATGATENNDLGISLSFEKVVL